jgi:PmbA protein
MAKGKKTTQIDIEAPTPEKIKESLSGAISFLKKMPDSFLYNGIEGKMHSYGSIDGMLDKNIKYFSDKAPELINVAIQSSLEEGARKVAGVLYYGFSNIHLMTNYENQGSYEGSYYRLTIRSFVDAESSGQGITCGRNLKDVEERFKMAGRESGKIAKMAVGGKQGTPGKYDLIMSPTVAANVLGQVTEGANPLRILIGMSPIKIEQLGKQIASDVLNIDDNALLSEGLGSRPFDVEGTPTGKTPIISNGILKGILHNTSSSIMNKVANTGNLLVL